MASKPNTFSDFIACARHLVDAGYTEPDRLVARGGSAGGLLIGAVANQAPELFAGLVAEVPFVDTLTTMLDETLPLTVGEWEEWGNPEAEPDVYATMRSYSPYDNVAPSPTGRFPQVLATAGLADPRVGYWEPAKWVARLRAGPPRDPHPAQDRTRGRSRRPVGALRRLAGRSPGLRVHPRCGGPGVVTLARAAGRRLRGEGEGEGGLVARRQDHRKVVELETDRPGGTEHDGRRPAGAHRLLLAGQHGLGEQGGASRA